MRAKQFLNEDWQKANKQDKTDGMSSKAVKAYRRENPGSKLQTAVTTKPSKLKKGSKASKRRSSYCSRSKGQMDMHNISCAKDPDKAICKARRRWNCEESIEELEQMLEEAKKTLRNSNPCWKGYKPVGTKKKAGKTVPNCVPVNEEDLGVSPKRPKRVGSRPERGHEPQKRYATNKEQGVAEGKTDKQEAPKPRNFVAKNAMSTTSGAGAHKDKKKAEKQGEVKHKGKAFDMSEAGVKEAKATRSLCTSSKPDSELGASMLASCKSQGLRSRDGNMSHKLGKSPDSRVKVGGHKIKGQKYGGPLPDWS